MAQANLRGCIAVPVVVVGTSKSFVLLFFTETMIQNEDFVRKTIEVVRSALQQNATPPLLGIPKPLDPAAIMTMHSRSEENSPSMASSRSHTCFYLMARDVCLAFFVSVFTP